MLGDKAEVQFLGAGNKVETRVVTAMGPGSEVEVRDAGDAMWVTELTRKGVPRLRVIVMKDRLVSIIEVPKR